MVPSTYNRYESDKIPPGFTLFLNDQVSVKGDVLVKPGKWCKIYLNPSGEILIDLEENSLLSADGTENKYILIQENEKEPQKINGFVKFIIGGMPVEYEVYIKDGEEIDEITARTNSFTLRLKSGGYFTIQYKANQDILHMDNAVGRCILKYKKTLVPGTEQSIGSVPNMDTIIPKGANSAQAMDAFNKAFRR